MAKGPSSRGRVCAERFEPEQLGVALAGRPGLQARKQRIRQLQGGAHHNQPKEDQLAMSFVTWAELLQGPEIS